MDFTLIAVIVAFVGGVLFDHMFLNKLAGLVQPEIAAVQASAARAEAAVEAILATIKQPQVVHVNVPPSNPPSAS